LRGEASVFGANATAANRLAIDPDCVSAETQRKPGEFRKNSIIGATLDLHPT